jgi:hypothetical protein
MIAGSFKTYIHATSKRVVTRCYPHRKVYIQPSSLKDSSLQSRKVSTLLRKMKVVVDKANEVCSTNNYTDDECLCAWNELDELVEHYKLLSKEVLIPKKKKVVDSNDWDVIH